ncbi:MAG: hypothetical protein RML36_04095 [Anaerolineae bacterium]|nr:hypothetical protein [Anaerolineae bacterium]MDW8098652.1 hypothetical protein [Anaerolineae bacterium]
MERNVRRMILLLPGMLALLAAMWGGLLRLGWDWPLIRPTLPINHGPLMIGGFLGTLIGLERAVALAALQQAQGGKIGGEVSLLGLWPYAAPLLTGAGALLLIAGVPGAPGPSLITLGSLALLVIFAVIVRTQPALFTATIGLGALAWLVGNLLWLTGRPIYSVVLWWAGFLVLTIVGERLELSRLLHLPRPALAWFMAAVGAFLAGLLLSTFRLSLGTRAAGIAMVTLALWLARYDIARRTVRQTGLPRFIAVCLLSGYVWLGISGILALVFSGVTAGPRYDALLHSLFLGFVFTMIFGHAPIIFPAVFRLPVSFRPAFYGHLALLHLTLILRVGGGLAGWTQGLQWGGLLNALVLLLFLLNTARAIQRPPAVAVAQPIPQSQQR